ncbi:MAG TPA: peptidoglycan-associated lipoprotein Pal [Vicinamibacterales bacterium]
MRRLSTVGVVLILISISVAACGRRQPPLTAPPPPPPIAVPPAVTPAPPPVPPPQPVVDALPVPPEPLSEDAIANRSLDDLNRESPFRPVFFALDESDLDDMGRRTAQSNADLLKKYQSWVVTVEGHCDERGTAEYNLALGERRAVAVKTYLVSLGIAPDRIRTVSYGKEFPFDPGHNENAWAKNRRAHFVITSK